MAASSGVDHVAEPAKQLAVPHTGGIAKQQRPANGAGSFWPPRCLAWAVTIAPACEPMFFGSAERRFSVPA